MRVCQRLRREAFADPPLKRLGIFLQFVLLQTLGLDMILAENPAALEVLQNPKLKRRQAWVLRRPSIQVFTPDKLRINGRKGARVRNVKLSERQRSAIARRAARARWVKHGGSSRRGRCSVATGACLHIAFFTENEFWGLPAPARGIVAADALCCSGALPNFSEAFSMRWRCGEWRWRSLRNWKN